MNAIFRKLLVHTTIRFGLCVLGLLVLIALMAPWLGTVDPAAMDSANINTQAGVVGQFGLLDGTSVAHTFWMGSDNFGRDIYSRVLYGTRVPLLVGLCQKMTQLRFEKCLPFCGSWVTGWKIQGQGGQGIQHTVVAHVLTVEGLDADDANNHFGRDAVGLLSTREGALVGLPKLCAGLDAAWLDEALAVSAPVFGHAHRRRHDQFGHA